ncbi:hypothetical protein [Allocoleopsis sp.]|uniref:hypothetical protein n=1 Tax=Allocoleopsis sp. TaxID=3088169 RepID=UPI002FD30740
MSEILKRAWGSNPPTIFSISQPMPDSPELPLTGGGTARMPLHRYLEDLQRDLKRQVGKYYAYVWEFYESGDEADIYTLQTWQVCTPNDNVHEAVVILYYAALNPYLTIKKHMGDDLAQEYKEQLERIEMLEHLISLD